MTAHLSCGIIEIAKGSEKMEENNYYLLDINDEIKQSIENKQFEKTAELLAEGQHIEEEDVEKAKARLFFLLGQGFYDGSIGNPKEQELIDHLQLNQNIDDAISCFESGVKYNSLPCINKLFKLYFYAKNGMQNFEKAFKLAKLGAELNDPLLTFRFGTMLFGGKGCEKNIKKAYECFEKSFQYDAAWGAYELGTQSEYGIMCDVDEKKAFTYYLLGANAGDKLSIFKCAAIFSGYFKNKFLFVEPDIDTSIKYYEKYLKVEHIRNSKSLKNLGALLYEHKTGKQKTDGIKKIVKAAKRNEESAINYLKYKTEFGDIQEEPNQNIVKMQEMAMSK